ncbi:hypothetical protein BsWGS_09336 [Bradybaena similaris]
MMKYGRSPLQPWLVGQNWSNTVRQPEKVPGFHGSYQYRGYANNAFHPGRYFHASQGAQSYKWPGMFATSQRGKHILSQSNNAQQKPRVITVVRNGSKPRPNVKILLYQRAMLSYEQLLADISGAFSPHWKNNNIQRLFTVRGKEVHGISDFFRGDDIYIAQGSGEPDLMKHEIRGILEELFADTNVVRLLLHDWRKNQRHLKSNYQARWGRDSKVVSNVLAADQKVTVFDSSVQEKRDSGFDSGDSNMNWPEFEHPERPRILRPRKRLGRKIDREGEQEKKEDESNYQDVASDVAQSIYGCMQIDMIRPDDQREDEGFNTATEHAKSKKKKIREVDLKKIYNVDTMKGLMPLNEISGNFKQINESVITKNKELLKIPDIIKEQQKLEVDEKSKEDRENAEKAARERMAEAEKEKHEKEASEKELLKKSARETHITKCDPHEHGIEMGHLTAPHEHEIEMGHMRDPHDSVSGSQNISDACNVNLSIETSVNQNSLSVNEYIHKLKAQNVKLQITTQANMNDMKDSQQSTKHSNQNPEATYERKRRTSKVVHKTKEERQVSSDDFVTSQFELGQKLGDGNFANVYQSRKIGTGREFAVKVIDKSKLREKEYMVENEISIMKDCRHHNIVRLYEEFETPSWIYLVMELVKGGDLFDAISQSVKFAEADSALMVRDLCQALFYLHSRRIVHRDIKPENLLVHRHKNGSVTLKLGDFGLAMEVKQLIYTVCGTPTYVAPEILSGTGYSLEVDMWAVGVITYILLCGFPPFRSADRNQTELFASIKAGQFAFLSPFWDHVSTNARDLISHLLVVDRKRRFTAIDVLSHMLIVCKGQTDIIADSSQFVDGLDLYLHRNLEEKARLNYQAYQRLTEKKRRQRK